MFCLCFLVQKDKLVIDEHQGKDDIQLTPPNTPCMNLISVTCVRSFSFLFYL